MRANYNMTGIARKELVKRITEITGEKARYKYMPTCAFEIGSITVDKKGVVTCDDGEELNRVVTALGEMGIYPEARPAMEPEETQETTEPAAAESDQETQEPEQEAAEEAQEPVQEEPELTAAEPEQEVAEEQEEAQEAAEEPEAQEQEEAQETGLTISLPLSSASVGNLTSLLTAKGDLIRKALGVDDIRIEVTEDRILFPWFRTVPEADEAKAYTDFLAAICRLSKELKHVHAYPHPVENEKYAFRCFLLRLGFIGAEYKPERKILLQNLSGNSSWKSGAPKKEETEQESGQASEQTSERASAS